MGASMLTMLRSYWEELRAGRVAPYRAELDPRKFEGALEHMFIVEQLTPNQLRVRLAGMRLCEMMGMEVRGMPPEAFMAARYREQLTEMMHSSLETPSVVEIDLEAEDRNGLVTRGQMLLLPLRSDFGEVTRILGCIVTDREVRHAPVNFAITGHRITAVNRSEAPAPMAGFGEAAAPFAGAGGAPKLRSIDGTRKDGESAGEGRKARRSRAHLKLVRDA